jgi:ABC-2 type transport system permease protein
VCGGVLIGAARLTGVVDLPTNLAELTVPSIPLIAAAFLFFLLGYVLLGSLMAALGAITTTQREAQQVVFLLVLPYIVPLWFIGPLLENPMGTTARVLSFIPFTAPITGMVRLGADGLGGAELALSLGVLAAAATLAVFFTLRVFQISLLMYGRRPRAGEVLGAFVRVKT